MYKIFCDETWNNNGCLFPCMVFYGVMIDEVFENEIIQEVEEFKKSRGLTQNGVPVEIKWKKVEEEWKNARKGGRESRYKGFLEIFFKYLKSKKISFAYLFLSKPEYDEKELGYLAQHSENNHNFFFMMYFQFLYHTFIKTQVKFKPCEIYIDEHDTGSEDHHYDINNLRTIINRKLYRAVNPKDQYPLDHTLALHLVDTIQLVKLIDSKQSPLIQLSDLCGGCVRYILENGITPPIVQQQLSLFEKNDPDPQPIMSGKDDLALFFYQRLREIDRYNDIDLAKPSYHHRFCIFPFQFS